MDPNAALTEARDLASRILAADGGSIADGVRLAELLESLDTWITRGGCLPAAWPAPTSPMNARLAALVVSFVHVMENHLDFSPYTLTDPEHPYHEDHMAATDALAEIATP